MLIKRYTNTFELNLASQLYTSNIHNVNAKKNIQIVIHVQLYVIVSVLLPLYHWPLKLHLNDNSTLIFRFCSFKSEVNDA